MDSCPFPMKNYLKLWLSNVELPFLLLSLTFFLWKGISPQFPLIETDILQCHSQTHQNAYPLKITEQFLQKEMITYHFSAFSNPNNFFSYMLLYSLPHPKKNVRLPAVWSVSQPRFPLRPSSTSLKHFTRSLFQQPCTQLCSNCFFSASCKSLPTN
jgi:hypothetical protein